MLSVICRKLVSDRCRPGPVAKVNGTERTKVRVQETSEPAGLLIRPAPAGEDRSIDVRMNSVVAVPTIAMSAEHVLLWSGVVQTGSHRDGPGASHRPTRAFAHLVGCTRHNTVLVTDPQAVARPLRGGFS
jgi:hypothetical protein